MNTYYIASAANIHIDQILKDVNTAYSAEGAVFAPVFNTDGTKALFQLKTDMLVPANAIPASILGDRRWLANALTAAEWLTRIYPPDSLNASYFTGAINLGQYLTQVRAIPPR